MTRFTRPARRACRRRRALRVGGICLRATTSPACQPGARPPAGGRIDSASIPLRAITHAITEFEFHISPVPSSSRPQTGVGTCATSSSTRRARCFVARSAAADCPRPRRRPGCVRRAKTDLVAEDPKSARPATADGAFGDDAPLLAAQVRDRRLLDDERRLRDFGSGARSGRGRRPDAAAIRAASAS